MDRKKFIKHSLKGFGSIIAIPTLLTSTISKGKYGDQGCDLSPSETAGPFYTKTPAQLLRENIVADRTGVALLMKLTINNKSAGCGPLSGVYVDVWHCDKDGNYSQYNNQTSFSYLRGRQKTDKSGQVSFISIFPGWYPGRAPHIHVEILDDNLQSMRVTQIAFPVDTYMEVLQSTGYQGPPDTSNTRDFVFANSLEANTADSMTGSMNDGYTLSKTLVV